MLLRTIVTFVSLIFHSLAIHSAATTSADWKRTLRRKRAVARFRWWKHRTGQARLTVAELRNILRTLSGHHSRDVHFLQKIRKQISMALTPWRCANCRRMAKAKAEYCPSCGQHWTVCQDRAFQPPHRSQQHWEQPHTPAGGERPRSSSTQRSSSRKRGKGKGTKGGKEGGKGSKRKQRHEEHGACIYTESLCALSSSPHNGTLAFYGIHKQCLAESAHPGNHSIAQCGAHLSSQKGISGWTPTRSPRTHRQEFGEFVQTADEGPAFGYNCLRKGTEGPTGGSGSRTGPPSGLVETPQRGHEALGGATGSIPKKVPGGENASWTGGRVCQKDDPSPECPDRPKRSHGNTCGRPGGVETRGCRSSRGRRLEATASKCIDGLCSSHRDQHAAAGRADQHWLGRRDSRRPTHKEAQRGHCWWRIGLMILGRDLTCPEGIVNREAMSSTMQDALASIQWHRTATHCGIENTFDELFSQHWEAQTAAINLRYDVTMDSSFCPSMSFLQGVKVLKKPRSQVRDDHRIRFDPRIELHIYEESELGLSPAIHFGIESLSRWTEKPWSLCPKSGFTCRQCIPHFADYSGAEVENTGPKSPVIGEQLTHVTTPRTLRLLDERNSVSVSANSADHAHIEGQEQHGDPEDEQLVIIDGWQDLLDILHQHTPSPDSHIHLEMYGLHITHHSIRITDCEATIAAIREAVQESWRDAMPPRSVAYIHLVRPQEQRHARAVVLQMIVEIAPFGVDIPPNDVPILRRIRWHRDHSMTLETAYMRDHQTGYELVFDAHLDEWCHPRHGVQCNLHIESRIALMAHRHHLLPGSLLEIFIHDDDRPEPSASSQQADPQTGLQQLAMDNSDLLQARLADWTSPQVFLVMYGLFGSSLGTRYSTSQVDYHQVRAAVHHTWQDYVQSETSVTLHMVRPQDDRQLNSLHLIVELTTPSQARPAGYLPILQRISWRNIWQGDTSAAVYRVPGQNMREMLAACSLAEWCGPPTRAICRIQVERRSIPTTELIEFQAGSLLEVLVSLQHVEEDGVSLLQSGTPVSVNHGATTEHVEPSNVSLGSLSTHVNDRWCDSLSTCDVQEASAKKRITQFRPNGDIVPDQDNQAPYQYRLHNGARITGTIIPPPNWNRLPGLRYAADRGAVVRDVTHQLRIRIRSWLVPHDRFGPMYWKDCTIPAQLFLRLLDRLQSVWQPELWQGDRLSMRIVQPTPAPPVGDQARLYILLECNRPRVGARKAILLSFQEFNSEGPSPDMTWIPYLAPEVITPQIIAGVLPMHCDPRHLIISAGTLDRRWLSEHEERAVADGLYLPILRDVRRAVPTQRIEVLVEDTGSSDDSSLMQLTSHTPYCRQCQPQDLSTDLFEQPPSRATGFLSTHVIDRWCDSLPTLNYDDSMPGIRAFKPNPNLVTDFDDELPYQRRVVNGATIITRDAPPPNWAEQPLYMVSSSLQAVARDGSGHLQVYFRTWLLHHNRDSPVESRDGQIRAQLMVNLHSRIRWLWRGHIGPDDTIKTTVVRPNPVLDRNEGPMLLLLVECNRPLGSPTRPILLTFQEIDARGPEPQRSWRAYLAPPTIIYSILLIVVLVNPFTS